jgi:malate dehydrogenase (oxaloacetate-decarboxylating)
MPKRFLPKEDNMKDRDMEALKLHKKLKGKIEIKSRFPIRSLKDLSLVYTPHVAVVSNEIHRDKKKVYDYTSKWNNVAIVTDGSRLLGLGNLGPEAALPVMEGKAMIFKQFGKINAFPICLATQEKHDIMKTVEQIAPVFGAINIEDIESPKSLEIVEHLQQELNIPVFHDDQHGTATVVLAALINVLKIVHKDLRQARIVIAGAGAAGYGIVKILAHVGAKKVLVVDSKGIINSKRNENMNPYKQRIANITNRENINGSLKEAIRGADVLIGVSGKSNLITKEMVGTMCKDAIVFALSNPDPEIMPKDAKKGGARIIATGRSDYYNQVNNALIFPFILRVALDLRIRSIDEGMLVNVATSLSQLVGKKLSEKYILPSLADKRILSTIARSMKNNSKSSASFDS